MKYVLDSSVAFKWAIVEADTAKARALRDDYCNGSHELISPDFFPIEIGHGLTHAERQGKITLSQAALLWRAVMQTSPLLVPALPLSPRAIDISSRTRQGVYDCVYVALAERESCELVTADDKLIKKLQPLFPFIVALSSLP
jgi:predicted nucleic acid-binding protein